MKLTLDITEEQYTHLKELQEDFAIQQANNQAEYPNVYVLVDYKEVVVDPDYESDYQVNYCDPDASKYDIPEDGLKAYLEDTYPEQLEEFLSEHEGFDWEWTCDVQELLDQFPLIYKVYNSLRAEDVQTFLTRKSAEEYLRLNRYHYHEKAFIDRRKVWRNPLMKSLILSLYNADLGALHE